MGSTGQFQFMLFLTVGCEVILNRVTCLFPPETITTNIIVFVVSNFHPCLAHIHC